MANTGSLVCVSNREVVCKKKISFFYASVMGKSKPDSEKEERKSRKSSKMEQDDEVPLKQSSEEKKSKKRKSTDEVEEVYVLGLKVPTSHTNPL